MISLICPSRSRPRKCYDNIMKWVSVWFGSFDFQIIVSVDSNDPELINYITLFDNDRFTFVINNNRSAVQAINHAVNFSTGDILMVVSDDTDTIQHWDAKIFKDVGSKKDWILKTQDGIQPWIITMPIMDRDYYNRFGYIYHPDYLHMFCDTELTCVADITGRKITSKLVFPHKHYSVTKQAPDAVAKRNDSTWAQGEKLFLERYKKNFDLPKGLPIQDGGMIKWLQNKSPR